MEYLEKRLTGEWAACDEHAHKETMRRCNIRRHQQSQPDTWVYTLTEFKSDDDLDGQPMQVKLEGCINADPLKFVTNCELIIVNKNIYGINVDGKCVINTQLHQILHDAAQNDVPNGAATAPQVPVM